MSLRHSWYALLVGMICGFTTMSQRVNARLWNGNLWHGQSKRSSKLNHQQGKWCWHFLLILTLEHCQVRDTTVNSINYSGMLWDWLRPGIWTKCQGMVTMDVALFHDSAWPHTCHSHSWHPQVFEFGDAGASFLLSWSGLFGLLCVWSTQKWF